MENIMSDINFDEIKYYTGVGSRKTPDNIKEIMTQLASKLERMGYILRSGGANGADLAFENGVKKKQNADIYLAKHCTPAAMCIAKKFHPSWSSCNDYAKKLHGRNAFQVLGGGLEQPSKFLVCWTPDGCISHKDRTIKTGGTGTAISIADYYKIEIINLKIESHFYRILSFINKDR